MRNIHKEHPDKKQTLLTLTMRALVHSTVGMVWCRVQKKDSGCDGHVGCFHLLAIVNSAAVNMGAKVNHIVQPHLLLGVAV